MKRVTTVLCLLAIALLARPMLADDAGARPNIVYIIADDMGYADAGFNGGKEIKTPAIDSIAAAGAILKQFYVQPVCSPTRASFMTGRYPMRMGLQVGVVRPWAEYGMPLEEQTLPQGLKSAGYETAIVGKWHLGTVTPAYLPTARGFDHQYGHYNGAIDYNTHIRDGGFDWHKNDKVNRDEGYSTHLIGREAVRLINERDKNKPLFLYVPFNAVHAPHQVPDEYTKPYDNLKGTRKTYAGMLAAMDEAIGKILKAIDDNGLRKNTLIVFHSDNGGPSPGKVTDNGSLRAGKGTVYEGGVRVCAVAAWEGHIKPGSVVDQPMHVVDMYPTLLKLAGAKVEQKLPLDGMDVWATIASGQTSPRKEILHNTAPGRGAIRMGDWKLVIGGNISETEGPEPTAADANPAAAAKPAADAPAAGGPRQKRQARRADGGPQIELFNVAKDPSEKTNVAEANPDKVKELRARYDVLAAQAVAPKSAPKAAGFKTPKVWGEKD
ncbi:arylsulfatase [Humisphaera borealis]|uniref:Sulfatase-like hydrolase/transferase n=1 Tax=Humisphaera borealis TaxID=2807512 RepID=A0A7M2WPI6_9BACT|nr:sulfatase-like hydrolase/transferase [Humisphaera borealis]QOV87435.1 sulfatase-like hydrolase/transferase [Humisphaera borealis]